MAKTGRIMLSEIYPLAKKKEGGEEKMEVTFDSLTRTIRQGESARGNCLTHHGKLWWNGYINALKDLRNNINSKT